MATSSDCADNIVLIGFMGAGKSTVGRLLARQSGRHFLDVDTLIAAACGMPVAEIFEKEGEAAFRRMERQSAQWLAKCVRGSVVSTGGGMPLAVDTLRKIGTVVYLKLPFASVMKRIDARERARRPLFKDPENAEMLFKEREERYESQADIVVDADRPPEAVAEEIMRRLADGAVAGLPGGE
ncbi:shikimate kinase [Hydrogenimonas sp. SS33]|uniref:shikimate kinase n=1 Tax=Hydrogenimonas leucolamina TaxID=2954236 RepID=UPI00336C0210